MLRKYQPAHSQCLLRWLLIPSSTSTYCPGGSGITDTRCHAQPGVHVLTSRVYREEAVGTAGAHLGERYIYRFESSLCCLLGMQSWACAQHLRFLICKMQIPIAPSASLWRLNNTSNVWSSLVREHSSYLINVNFLPLPFKSSIILEGNSGELQDGSWGAVLSLGCPIHAIGPNNRPFLNLVLTDPHQRQFWISYFPYTIFKKWEPS